MRGMYSQPRHSFVPVPAAAQAASSVSVGRVAISCYPPVSPIEIIKSHPGSVPAFTPRPVTPPRERSKAILVTPPSLPSPTDFGRESARIRTGGKLIRPDEPVAALLVRSRQASPTHSARRAPRVTVSVPYIAGPVSNPRGLSRPSTFSRTAVTKVASPYSKPHNFGKVVFAF